MRLGLVHPLVLPGHAAQRGHDDQQGVLRDRASQDRARPAADSAEHAPLHRDHAARRAGTRQRRLEAVRAHPSGARASATAPASLRGVGRDGLRHAVERGAPGPFVGQLLGVDAPGGPTPRRQAGPGGPGRLHADLALRLVAGGHAGRAPLQKATRMPRSASATSPSRANPRPTTSRR